jgi:hypothetical protein
MRPWTTAPSSTRRSGRSSAGGGWRRCFDARIGSSSCGEMTPSWSRPAPLSDRLAILIGRGDTFYEKTVGQTPCATPGLKSACRELLGFLPRRFRCSDAARPVLRVGLPPRKRVARRRWLGSVAEGCAVPSVRHCPGHGRLVKAKPLCGRFTSLDTAARPKGSCTYQGDGGGPGHPSQAFGQVTARFPWP